MRVVDADSFESDLLSTLIPDIFLRNKRKFTVGDVRTMLKKRPTIDP